MTARLSTDPRPFRPAARAASSSPARLIRAMAILVSAFMLAFVAATVWPTGSARAADAAKTSQSASQSGGLDAVLKAFPNGLTPEQLDAILAVTGETDLRSALRERLLSEGANTAQNQTQPTGTTLEQLRQRLLAVVTSLPTVPAAFAAAFAHPPAGAPALGPIGFLLRTSAIVLSGFAGLYLIRALWRRSPIARKASSGRRAVIGRALSAIVDVVAFLGGMVMFFLVMAPDNDVAPRILEDVLVTAAVPLIANRLANFILSPKIPGARLIGAPDNLARTILHQITIAAILLAIPLGLARILITLQVEENARAAANIVLSVVPVVYLMAVAGQYRDAVAADLARRLEVRDDLRPLIAGWLIAIRLYLAVLWIVMVGAILQGEPGIGIKMLASLLVLIAAPITAIFIRMPLARFYGEPIAQATPPRASWVDSDGDALPPVAEDAPPPPAEVRATGTRHVRRLMRVVWIVLIALAVLATFWIWGFDFESNTGIGGVVIRVLFNISIVLLLGYVGWALILRAIDRAYEAARNDAHSIKAQRLATLLPLFGKVLQVTLLAMTAMIVLSSLGVNIGPLLAGAGVVGIAIGLGAQQTVADILAGVFFLIEDSFRVGDYVEVGNLRGVVESISLRSMKLRHHRGAVHTLPFGQMKAVTNQTRDWALLRMDFRVDPNTDITLVKRLIKKIGTELSADPDMGPNFIEPLKSQGIRSVEDGAIVIGVKFIAKPNTQFVIRREAYTRILKAFKENHIELVGRGVVVKVEGADVSPEIAGAAAEAALDAGQGAKQ
ncbi:mechanosensitive ion channel domain-containing protein [Segnochrobactrum spirostomi]|uniref:mechanosensitive ion channel domain-containing protein n=1 Tax=Segnochrobactrum spirostomi TaxID=2608987 RepID=UPI001AD809FD|nr:mechanosensitive ion channel domain-containing protein [Segnochrobactrum spirostomi]